MKKLMIPIISLIALLLIFTMVSFITPMLSTAPQPTEQATQHQASVIAVKKMKNHDPIILNGYITTALGGERYLFKDDSAEIAIEFNAKKGYRITRLLSQHVQITGHVKSDWLSTSIEVEHIEKIST